MVKAPDGVIGALADQQGRRIMAGQRFPKDLCHQYAAQLRLFAALVKRTQGVYAAAQALESMVS